MQLLIAKGSRETDFKLCAVGMMNLSNFAVDDVAGPCNEAPPVVFGMSPYGFDQVQLRTVGWQQQKNPAIIEQPPLHNLLIEAVTDFRFVERHQRRLTRHSIQRDLRQELESFLRLMPALWI